MEPSIMSKRKELLIGMLKDSDPDVVNAAAAALERLESRQSLDEVLDQLKKGGLAEKIRAIYALGTIGGAGVLKPLVYCASRPEEDIRSAAVEVLGDLAERSTLPALLEKLNDDNSAIRAKAIKALGNFADRGLNIHLLPFLKAGDGLTDVEAVLALAKTSDTLLEERFIALASSPIAATRAAAATALGMINPA
ncbi:MAG: HEAT repeat domain-containing protein [Geobacteraceae bacterium]|nr:HEAT repeat domain-containing protein [Geobacteraceae bacterium]